MVINVANWQQALFIGFSFLSAFANGQSPIEKASQSVNELHESLSDLGIAYSDAVRKLDQQYLDRVETLLTALASSLEDSRKEAVQKDLLDKALKLRELIDQYAKWIDDMETEPTIPKPKATRKLPAEIVFERELAIAKRDRERAVKNLDVSLLKDSGLLRDATLGTLENLRVDAMKLDNIDQAKTVRDLAAEVKAIDLSMPFEANVKATNPEMPKGAEKTVGECVVVIPPVKSTTKKTVTIPKDVKKVEASFFYESTPEHAKSRFPGYKGILRVNDKLVIGFARKYQWKDGKSHSTYLVFDGVEMNTRHEATLQGAIDITSLVKPGETVNVTYGNGQRTPLGVRFYFHK